MKVQIRLAGLEEFRQFCQQSDMSAIIALYQNTENCQVATLNPGNFSRQVADVECLQRALEQQRGGANGS